MKRGCKPRNAARDQRIAEARVAGSTLREIADAYGITKQRADQITKRLGAVPQVDRLRKSEMASLYLAGKTAPEIGADFGVRTATVCRRIQSTGVEASSRRRPTPLWDRLSRRIVFASGCWMWSGSRNRSGYGVLPNRPRGRSQLAHRLVYESLVGDIPEGLCIDHLCRTPACVNPYHMEPVTLGENVRRGVGSRGRRGSSSYVRPAITHCHLGHPFEGENLYVWRGLRQCRTCQKRREAARTERRRAAKAA